MRKIKNISQLPIYILDDKDVIHEFLPEELSIREKQIYETGKKKPVSGKSIDITVTVERIIDPTKSKQHLLAGVEDLPRNEDPEFLFIIDVLSFKNLKDENIRRKDVATIFKKNTFLGSYNGKDVSVTRILTLL